jgi:nucleoid DNA-binding protein
MLSKTEQEITKQIAKDNDIDIKEVEEIVSLSIYVIENVLKRGMNIDLGAINFQIIKEARGVLRKQRLGDQKEIVKCIRFAEKISTKRQQTYLKVNNLKNKIE